MAVINGVDVDKIKQTQDQVKKDPALADREPKMEAHWLGGSATRIEFGDVSSYIGGDGNLNAMQTLLAALAACDIDLVAMHAALTGHLVFSTLHTNDAPGTVPCLIDMGVKPNIIAPAINIAMAQRLVRKLCKACKKKTEASPEDIKKIKAEMEKFPKGIEKPDLGKAEFFAVVGCDACGGTGYKGRIGVFEGFEIDDAIERLILTEPSESALREAAIKQGMLTMKQDGIIKLLSGVTTLEELERVIGS